MDTHPTTQTQSSIPPSAVVFVGPPASGKTTLRTVCEDFGACGLDLEQFHTHGDVTSDGYRDAIEQVLDDAAQTELGVCCIEGAVSPGEISVVRQHATSVLVIRVTVADTTDRVDRYVERELDIETGDPLNETQERAVRDYALARERVETPYPDHDVTINNGDDVPTSELLNRVAHLLDAVSMQETPVLVSPQKDDTLAVTDRTQYLQDFGAAGADGTGPTSDQDTRSVAEIVADVTVYPDGDSE